ncbi:fibrinogen-like protein 1 [Anopheles aquasalis]|uniref:fibrinogen-like protein 1 n=1 Tax=Anopheles aquasalis TaxID=42839 RepID=UPI00215A4B80|nr:fibrinogen-like protein 1 [Anopheles aquasalis]
MQRMFRFIVVSYIVYLVCANNSTKETVADESLLPIVLGCKNEDVLEITRENHTEESFKLSKREMELQNVTEANPFQTSKSDADVLAAIEQGIKLLVSVQQESQAAIAENQDRLNQSLKLVGDLVQQIDKIQTDLSKLREEATNTRTADINRMQRLERSSDEIQSKVTTIERMQQGSFRSCKEIATKTPGIYNIRPSDALPSFLAYCDQYSYGEGWMVIQSRKDGSENFNRSWNDYRNGFGKVDGEHWLGLERLYQITKNRACELFVGLQDFNNTYKYAYYNAFAIGSASEGYYLKTLGTYSGNAGDSLRQHKGMKFSTHYMDYDAHANANCAKTWHGGWWFNACYHAFLNGLYQNVSGRENAMIGWFGFHNEWRGLSYSRMMIRPLK